MNESPVKSLVLSSGARGAPIELNRRTKEADWILFIGRIQLHTRLGVSGGFKMLVPGLAASGGR